VGIISILSIFYFLLVGVFGISVYSTSNSWLRFVYLFFFRSGACWTYSL